MWLYLRLNNDASVVRLVFHFTEKANGINKLYASLDKYPNVHETEKPLSGLFLFCQSNYRSYEICVTCRQLHGVSVRRESGGEIGRRICAVNGRVVGSGYIRVSVM